jgi:hypothetical protein
MRPERVQAEMGPGHDRVDHPLADHDGGRDGTRCVVQEVGLEDESPVISEKNRV